MIDYENPDEINGLVRATLDELEPRHKAADAVLSSIYESAYEGGEIGEWWASTGCNWPENVHYEFIQHTGAHLGFRLPRATVKSHRGRGQKAVADGIERGLNRWTREKHVGGVVNRLLDDMLIGYACSAVLHASNDVLHSGGKKGKRMLPKNRSILKDGHILADTNPTDEVDSALPMLVRLDRRDVFYDTLADAIPHAMFAGHRFVIDRSRLRALAAANVSTGYDVSCIDDLEKAGMDGKLDSMAGGVYQYRDMVAVHEVWFPEWRLKAADAFEEKHKVKTHGTMVTVAAGAGGSTGKIVRKARPYYGPREGAYVIGGMIEHPRYPMPTSPCVMAHAAAKELNAVSMACILSARGYKRLVLVDSSVSELGNKLKQSPHDYIVEVDGLLREGKPAIVPIEIGGITPQLLEIKAQMMERYERVSGLSEVRRGRATGGSTATEELIADQGADKRLVRLERPWDSYMSEVYRRVGFFLYDSRDVVFSFGEDESEQIAKQLGLDQPGTMPADMRTKLGAAEDAPAWKPGEELFFRGGDTGSEGTFDDLDIATSLSSQRKPDDPAQAAAVSGFVAELVSLIPTMAQVAKGVQWDRVLDAMAESKGVPEMAELVDAAAITGNPALAMPMQDMASTVGVGRTKPSINVTAQAPRPAAAKAPKPAAPAAQPKAAQPAETI